MKPCTSSCWSRSCYNVRSQQPRTFAYLSVGWWGRCPCPITLVRSQQYLTDSSIFLNTVVSLRTIVSSLPGPPALTCRWSLYPCNTCALAGLGRPLLIGENDRKTQWWFQQPIQQMVLGRSWLYNLINSLFYGYVFGMVVYLVYRFILGHDDISNPGN